MKKGSTAAKTVKIEITADDGSSKHKLVNVNPASESDRLMILYMLEVQTALAGELYNVDAFNQPGVERGKKLTCAMMGRKGYEQLRGEIEQIERRSAGKYEVAVR